MSETPVSHITLWQVVHESISNAVRLYFRPLTLAIIAYQNLSNRKKADIRRALYEIDRALTKGFACLMTLGSLLDEFSFSRDPRRIGGDPIRGVQNAELLRRTYEDFRAAMNEARDAFTDLSALLPSDHAEVINKTIRRLDELSEPILNVSLSYGVFLVAAALALQEVDNLICHIGERYDFPHSPRDFSAEIMRLGYSQ
jgi:hypothetical protein